MQRILTLAFGLALIVSAASAATDTHMALGGAPHCATGVACGNTCIAKGKVCHITPPKPHCTTGVPCGTTCVAKGKACHKT
jgi:hypothetical protein